MTEHKPFSLYGSFTTEEAADIGKQFIAICVGTRGMENHLTDGKEYIITIADRILPLSPLCTFIGDNGKFCTAHLTRFEKRT